MAAASVKVMVDGEVLRTYGGNRKEVRNQYNHYKSMSYEDFLISHPRCSEEEFLRAEFTLKLNKYRKQTEL